MDLKQLEYFTAVVEEGNISAAAKKLHISQPPLSNQIHLLEDEFNCTLFERGARKIQLTEPGRILYDRAVTLLEMAELLKREINDYSKGSRGVLRFGLISSLSSVVAGEWLCDFNKKYPEVNFEISEANTYQIIDMLRANLLELAVVRAPFPSEGIEILRISKEPMLAAGNISFIGNKKTIRLKELENKPLLIYRRWEKQIRTAFAEEGTVPNIFCVDDDARTTAVMADKGMGIAVFPESASEYINAENTVKAKIECDMLYSEVDIVVRKNTYRSQIARNFIEFIKDKYKI